MAYFEKKDYKKDIVIMNDDIRSNKILLIDEEGNKLWIFSKAEALEMAEKQIKDVIQIGYNPENNMVTAKLMEMWKYLYQQQKDTKEKKKTQKVKWVKEVKFNYSIWQHDLEFKLKKAKEFLQEWYSVKFVAVLRWRENMYQNKAIERLQSIAKELEDLGKEQWIKREKNWFWMVLLAKVK